MIRQPVCRPLSGLSCQRLKKIFSISRRSMIAAIISLSTFAPTTALGGHSATRSLASVANFSDAMRPGRPPISPQLTDPPDARPDPFGEDRVVNQLYEKLMRDSGRVLNVHE
jgi:hypothetical protein